MKRFLTLALTFAMCLTLVSCSGTTTSESPASTERPVPLKPDDTVYELSWHTSMQRIIRLMSA